MKPIIILIAILFSSESLCQSMPALNLMSPLPSIFYSDDGNIDTMFGAIKEEDLYTIESYENQELNQSGIYKDINLFNGGIFGNEDGIYNNVDIFD